MDEEEQKKPVEICSKAHYYLLAKGQYEHGTSWLEEFRKIACFYLDKPQVTNWELFNHIMPEVDTCYIVANVDNSADLNTESEAIYHWRCVMNLLDKIEFNPDIANYGWWEAWAEGCAIILMRILTNNVINLGEPDGRILPIVQNETTFKRRT